MTTDDDQFPAIKRETRPVGLVGRWWSRRRVRRETWRAQEREVVLALVRAGISYSYPLARIAHLRPGRLYPALHALEAEGLIVGEFDEGPYPRPRRYRAVG